MLQFRDDKMNVDDKAFQDIQAEFEQFRKPLKVKGKKKKKLKGYPASSMSDISINSDVTSSRKKRKGKTKNKKYASRKEDTKGGMRRRVEMRKKRKTMEEANKESTVESSFPKDLHTTSEIFSENTKDSDQTKITCSEPSQQELTSDAISKINELIEGNETMSRHSPDEARFCSD